MTLTVLNVAYPFAPVGPDAVGGAEQVLSQVDAALARAGNRSIVVAARGSHVRGSLIATDVPHGPLTEDARRQVWAQHRAHIAHAVRSFDVDVVHMHGVDFHAYLPEPSGVPVLVSLHLPPSWYPASVFRGAREDVVLHCVSWSQHRSCPPGAPLIEPIENGVPDALFAPPVRKRNYAIALGRICPEKNWHAALEAGHLAHMPVLLAGQVFPYEAHALYFDDVVLPLLDAQRRFVGPLGLDRKRRLLSRARCLLLPTLAPETSSLVAMEALACGTPVIAYPSGALPEIIEHGVTGFLVQSPREMAAAMLRCAAIDPRRCQSVARKRFTGRRMTDKYLDVYGQLARHATCVA